jgi:hypothetical protein
VTARDDALRLAVVRVLGDRVKAAEMECKAALWDAMATGERWAAQLPDGTVVGWVPKVRGATYATVTNPEEFVRWVAREHPTEVETEVIPAQPERTVHTVRPAFEKRLLQQWKELGVAVDLNGEEVPGVRVSQGDPIVKVEVTAAGPVAVTAAWASGALSVADVLALPEPDGGES